MFAQRVVLHRTKFSCSPRPSIQTQAFKHIDQDRNDNINDSRVHSNAQASCSGREEEVASENPWLLQPTRRALLAALPALTSLQLPGPSQALTQQACVERFAAYLTDPDYSQQGPLEVVRLPRLEHTCTSCFPACVGTNCIIRLDVHYPKVSHAPVG